MERTVKLPNQSIIKQRMSAEKLHYFLEKTKIDKNLADKELSLRDLVSAVENHAVSYMKVLEQPWMAATIPMTKQYVIETLLKDHPKAIEQLKTEGILEKN